MKNPKVLMPPGFDVDEAWKGCREWVDSKEPGSIAAAAGADPGCCSCPACGEMYWNWGVFVECDCGFQFPTDWWSQYSKGCNDARRVAGCGEMSGGMRHRRESNPYYREGFDDPPDGDAWKAKDSVDWRAVASDWKPQAERAPFAICERCGQEKEKHRRNRSGLCIKCESETECRHRCSLMEECCKAGVNFKELAGDEPGIMLRLPCFYTAGATTVVECPKRELKTADECQAEDDEIDRRIAELMLVGPLISEVKKQHKGQSWAGTRKCPICEGTLHLSHASYNGHVHGRCETKGCVSWME